MTKVFLVLIFLLVLFDLRSIGYAFGFFGTQGMYPDKAIAYAKAHRSEGQLFSTYNWGGYLIWQYPSKKVFIDGRMPSWRWNENIPTESNYAFVDYQQFLDGETPFETVTNKYNIDMLLIPAISEEQQNALEDMLANFAINVLHLPLKKDVGITKIVEGAKKAGWVIVYQDDMAVIYQKKN